MVDYGWMMRRRDGGEASIVVISILPEVAPHMYSINSDMLGTSTPENRYSNPWFLKHFDTETQTSLLQQDAYWGAHLGM